MIRVSRPLPRRFAWLPALAFLAAGTAAWSVVGCGPSVPAKPLPDLPPPEYEPARKLDLNAKPTPSPAPASPPVPAVAPAPAPSLTPPSSATPAPAPPKG